MHRRIKVACRGANTETSGVIVLLSFLLSTILGPGSKGACLAAVAYAAEQGTPAASGAQTEILPEEFGAVGDGLHDDSVALQSAVNAALKLHTFTVIRLASGRTYKIGSAITIDYRGQGQILRQGISFLGVGSKVFLNGTTGSFYAFNILLDPLPEQDTKVLFDGIWFYTDNVNRPNGINTNYACFVTIRNCVFYQLWEAVTVGYGYKVSVLDCSFNGDHTGVKMYRTRDSTVMAFSAYANDVGFWFEGVNDVGTDGNISIINGNVGGGYLGRIGIYMKRLYTPHIADVVVETQNEYGILMESCNFANLTNVFLGPQKGPGLAVRTVPQGVDSDYWNISNLTTQTETDLSRLMFSNLSNINLAGLGTSPSGSFLQIDDCHYLSVSNLSAREFSGKGISAAVSVSGSSDISFRGGLVEEKPVKIASSCRYCSIMGLVMRDADLVFAEGTVDPTFYGNYLQVREKENKSSAVVIEGGQTKSVQPPT